MQGHFHTDIIAVIFCGVSAILVIQTIRLSAGMLAKQDGVLGTVGKALGATVSF